MLAQTASDVLGKCVEGIAGWFDSVKNETKLFCFILGFVWKVISSFRRINTRRHEREEKEKRKRMIYDSAPDPFCAPDENGKCEKHERRVREKNKSKNDKFYDIPSQFPLVYHPNPPAYRSQKRRESERRYFFGVQQNMCL